MPNPNADDWFHLGSDERGATIIYIYDEIPTNAEPFFAEFNSIPAPTAIDLFVNCMGGDVYAAMAIHDRLKAFARNGCTVTAYVEGVAASGAALILAAADQVQVCEDGYLMLHEPYYVDGRPDDDRVEAMAAGMARRLAERTGRERTEVRDLLREERWFGAKEAVSLGLANGIFGEEGVRE